jgi:hypothetical protein
MRRREFIALVGGVSIAWPLVTRAQKLGRPHQIGILSPGRSELPDPTLNMLNAFLQALHGLGYTEGQNLTIERQYANGSSDRLRELAAELVRACTQFGARQKCLSQLTDPLQRSERLSATPLVRRVYPRKRTSRPVGRYGGNVP